MDKEKKVLFSGIQPSGVFTIGNYFGAIKNWVSLQEEYNCFYSVVDLHAITMPQVPQEFRKNSRDSLALLLASGLDPKKSTIFYQSHVSAHSELAWILNCFSYMGELNRMTQFKDKSLKQGENIRVGLYSYPVLMAADILLYQTELVPVGQDQKQHLELARDIASRFNNAYSPTFKIPDPYIPKVGARVMSLQTPESKMSKSDENKNAFVCMTDQTDTIIKKFKRAITDSGSEVLYDAINKKGISNLMEIYSSATGKTYQEIERQFDGQGYGVFKEAVGVTIADTLKPIQEEYKKLLEEKGYMEEIIKAGAEVAKRVSNKTLMKVKKKVGFILPE